MKVKYGMNNCRRVRKMYFNEGINLFELKYYDYTGMCTMNSSIVIEHGSHVYKLSNTNHNVFSCVGERDALKFLLDISIGKLSKSLMNEITKYSSDSLQGNFSEVDDVLYFIDQDNNTYKFQSIYKDKDHGYHKAVFCNTSDSSEIVEFKCTTSMNSYTYVPMHYFYVNYDMTRIRVFFNDISILLERDPYNINTYSIYMSTNNKTFFFADRKEFNMSFLDVLILFTTTLDVVKSDNKTIVTFRSKDCLLKEVLGVAYDYI